MFGNIFQQKRLCLARIKGIQKTLAKGPSNYLMNLEIDHYRNTINSSSMKILTGAKIIE